MEIDTGSLILFAAVALTVVAMAAAYFSFQSRRKAWEELASRLGLTYVPGNMFGSGISVSGTYHNQNLTMDKFTRGAGKNQSTYTRIVLHLKQPTQLELNLNTEGVFSKIGKMLGSNDIQTGDEAIDQRYMIKGQPENMIFNLLQSYDLRQKLIEAPSLNIRVKGQEIYSEKRGFNKDENNLVAMFDLMTSMASSIERLEK